jgi:hypothetical protein
MLGVKASSGLARTSRAIRRRFSCVLRSASWRADAAPTPNIMPAVVGAEILPSSSGTRSFSDCVHCARIGSQESCRSDSGAWKNLGSLKASEMSFLSNLFPCATLVRLWRRSSRLFNTFSGNALARKLGPMIEVDMSDTTLATRSFSTRIRGSFGTMEVRIATTSEALCWARGPFAIATGFSSVNV